MFKGKILVVLLGSSSSREYLRQVAFDLRLYGYRVVLLEEHANSPADPDLTGKFRRLLSLSPDYFISFFLKESTSYDALRLELEMLMSKYGKSLRKKLLVLHNGFAFKKESTFIESLFTKCIPVLFDDSKFYSRSPKLIHKFISDNERQRENSLVKRFVNLFGIKAG
jgi:hypothetical protein